jgi:hypothetical protein
MTTTTTTTTLCPSRRATENTFSTSHVAENCATPCAPLKSSSIQTLGLQVRRFSWNAKRMQGENTFDLETHRYIASVLDPTPDLRPSNPACRSLLQLIEHVQERSVFRCNEQFHNNLRDDDDDDDDEAHQGSKKT